jgi:hypothetical protein
VSELMLDDRHGPTAFDQAGGERVSQGVSGMRLVECGLLERQLEGALSFGDLGRSVASSTADER